MNHGIRYSKLNRNTGQRKALLKGLVRALVLNETIETTLCRAKALRPFIEKKVTLARRGDLNARRLLMRNLGHQQDVIVKFMNVLGPRYKERLGGYTRIVKCGYRVGDSAPMAVIQFV